jgi:exo-beta-1,3-glucanase (GH17 family)
VRSFSCTDGNDLIPKIAHEFGLKTLVGAWLGSDHEKNAVEVAKLIEFAKNGYVDIAVVGNEVMYRQDLSEAELLGYMQDVKDALPGIPVSYVDAYYEFENRPAITAMCDVILTNCYPFWEGCALEYSLLYMKDMYRRTKKVAGGKPVIISETGWPNKGLRFHGASPSERNAMSYFINAQGWSSEEDIPMFYFSSFDESWKIGDEGDVGAYWGLWDKDEKLKY